MAKTIKFNLILDGKPIRDIKGLQKHFCIDDVLDFYQKGLLQKWLKVRGFDEYLKEVDVIKENESAIIQLIKIFDIKKSEKEIKEAVYSLEFWEERKIELEEWNKKNTKIKNIIADYHNGYDILKHKILENKGDISFLKAAATEIFDKYLELFKINFKQFFEVFQNDNPLMVYAVLMNKDLRCFFLEDDNIKKKLKDSFALEDSRTTKEIVLGKSLGAFAAGLLGGIEDSKDKSLIKFRDEYYDEDSDEYGLVNKIKEKIKDKISLNIFKGETDGYWKDLEVEKTKVMVLSIPDGTFIRSASNPKEELAAKDVNGNFLILDGLLYKSNTDYEQIVYMEV